MNNQDLPLFDTPITPSEETDREITEYLIRRFNLADAILCSPPNRSAVPQRIFYYSADSKLLLSDVNLALSEELSTHIRIDHVIHLNTLPLNMDGDIDLGQLRALPIYSEGLLAEVEQQVAHMLGTHEQVAILVDYEHQLPWIHVDELIAARSRLSTEDRTDGVDEQSAADTASRATKPSWLTTELPEEVMQNNSSLAEMFLASCRTGSGKFICLDASLQEDTYTYYDILSRAQSLLTGLRLHGLQPAEPVLIQLSEPAQIITAFWACQLGGFIPLILPELHDFSENSRQGRNYRHVWQVLNRPLTITSDEWVEKIAALFDQQLTGSTARVVTYRSLEPHPAAADYAQPDSRTTALYVLSSGSTGVPKIIPLTHYNLITRALATNALTASKPADICLAWLPFDHIGTISDWHIRCVLLSNTVVLAKHEVLLGNILYFLDVIDKYRVTHTWAPNFAYALMNAKIKSGIHAGWDLSCVVTLLSAGEAVLPSVIREFHALLLPHKLALGAIKPAFGMAETGSGITYFTSRSESVNDRIIVVDRHSLSRSIAAVEEGHLRSIPYSCLGGPIPGMSLRIVDQHQKVVEQGVMGQLQVTGTALFAGYYNAPDVNADSFTDDGWFPTGDLGFIYNDQLVICGREKEVIIINGVNISAAEVEGVTEQVQGVLTSFTCACAVQDHNQHEVLAIFFAFDDSVVSQAEILTQIRKSVTEKVGISPTYLIPLDKAEIPKTPIGKIQRTQLMQRFANGLYKHIIRRTDLLLKNERTIPPWFYQSHFMPKKLRAHPQSDKRSLTDRNIVVFGRAHHVNAGLSSYLSAQGNRVVVVESTEQVDLLLQRLHGHADTGLAVVDVIFYTGSAQTASINPLHDDLAIEVLKLHHHQMLTDLQQIAAIALTSAKARVVVISRNIFPLEAQPYAPLAYANAALIGLIRTLQQELPNRFIKHVDLSGTLGAGVWAQLAAEAADPRQDAVVHYQDGCRFIQRLRPLVLQHNDVSESPFVSKGFYVVTGGLGGIGYEFVKWFLANHQASLLILGRTSIDPTHPSDKRHRLDALGQYGDRVLYRAADIASLEATAAAVKEAQQHFGVSLSGIVHLAGVNAEQRMVDLTNDTLDQVFSGKAYGAINLARILLQSGGQLFIAYSSVIAYMGSALIGAYSAANSFLEGFCVYLNQMTNLKAYCYAWTSWRGLGMSASTDYSHILAHRGYFSVTIQAGLMSTNALLEHGITHCYVGLHARKHNIAKHLITAVPESLMTCVVVPQEVANEGMVESMQARDHFHNTFPVTLKYVEELPKTAAGEYDRPRIKEMIENRTHRVPPATQTEKELYDLWGNLLNQSDFGIQDSFFDLGGDSLAAIQLCTYIKTKMGVDLSLATLFEAQTISQLASVIKVQAGSSTSTVDVLEVSRFISTPDKWTPLVCIQVGDGRKPIFCVHGGYGDVLIFQALATRLGDSQPFYAFQAQGIDGKLPPLNSIEEMAELYYTYMRQIQPSGPYLLAGFSGGGLIAHKIAQMLHDDEEYVGLLVLLDTDYPRGRYLTLKVHLQVMRHFGVVAYAWPRLKVRTHYALSRFQRWQQQAQSEVIPYELRKAKIMDSFRTACERYQPTYYAGTIHLFQTTTTKWAHCYLGRGLGWQEAADRLEIYELPGDHTTFLVPPHVDWVALKLKELIAQV